MISKLTHLLVAGAIVTGGAGVVTTAIVGPAGAAPVGASQASVSPEHKYADSLPTLRLGSSGAAVLGMQSYLIGRGAHLNGTGYYGANTVKAVKHYQAKHGLPVTGVVGKATWRKVISNQYHLPEKQPNPQLSPGANVTGSRGAIMFNMTIRLGLPWFPYSVTDQTVYNGKLLADVKTFQKRVGLQGTGVFGAKTTQRMVTVISIAGNWNFN